MHAGSVENSFRIKTVRSSGAHHRAANEIRRAANSGQTGHKRRRGCGSGPANASRVGTWATTWLRSASSTTRTIERYIHAVPQEPKNIAETGINDTDLLAIFMKIVFSGRMEKVGQIADAIKLPQPIVMDLARMAIERQLIYTLGCASLRQHPGHALCDHG